MYRIGESIHCDVLVIGSGAAGLRAALAAAEHGCRPLVVSKGAPGKGTCTFFSAGVMAAFHDRDGAASYMDQVRKVGRGINQPELVRAMAEDGPERLEELIRWGIRGKRQKGHLNIIGRAPAWGAEIVSLLIRKVRTAGVRLLHGLTIFHLFADGDCFQAIALDNRSGCWVSILAAAVVVASGGASALFKRHDNPRGMLGQGVLLAMDAGATIQDLEFVQFFPLGLNIPGKPAYVMPPIIADKGLLYNDLGENILEKYGISERPAASMARDRLSQALFVEQENYGAKVWLDLRHLPETAWKEDPFSASMQRLLVEHCGASERPLSVAPMAHHTMGGIRIDVEGGTGVPGLFAAGEVTGGLHGANRMGGNALTETLVFGNRAGCAAARHVSSSPTPLGSHSSVPDDLAPTGAVTSGREFLEEIRSILWHGCGIMRDGAALERTRKDLLLMQSCLQPANACEPDSFVAFKKLLTVKNALRMAELIVLAAERRQESRGAHFRRDFPAEDDDAWNGHLQWRLARCGEPICTFSEL